MFRAVPSYPFAALFVAALFGLPVPAMAQGLGLSLDLGGLGSLDVDLGGNKGDPNAGTRGGKGNIGTGLDLAPDSMALGQQAASAAVKSGRALPLEDILLRARLLTDGDIIDAQLVAVQDVLLYEIKVLGKAGDVSELYFYARSGLPVE